MSCLKRFLPSEFVKPYAPNQDIPWAQVSLESDWLLRFKDPRVNEEFNVYKHRDLVFPFLMIFMSFGGWFFLYVPLPTQLIPVGGLDWALWVTLPATMCGILGVIDYWAFMGLDAANGGNNSNSTDTSSTTTEKSQRRGSKRRSTTRNDYQEEGEVEIDSNNKNNNKTNSSSNNDEEDKRSLVKNKKSTSTNEINMRERLATIRWFAAFLGPLFAIFEDIPGAVWFSYDEHCIQTPQWITWMGLRTGPLTFFTSRQITSSCAQIVSPFTTFVEVLIVSSSTVSTIALLPTYLLDIVLRVLVEFRPRKTTSIPSEDLWVQALMGLVASGGALLMHAVRHISSMNQFRQEIELRKATELSEKRQEEVDTLLCNLMPLSTLDRLSRNEAIADACLEATVLFSDMKDFTAWSGKRTAQQVVEMLNIVVLELDLLAAKHRVEKVKTIGDAYWAVAGLPDECLDHAGRMINFGCTMLEVVSRQNKKHREWGNVQFRVGVHSGALFGGILGSQQLSYEVFGETSTIANQTEQHGIAGRVCITEDCREILLDEIPGIDEQIWEDVWGKSCASFPFSQEEGGAGPGVEIFLFSIPPLEGATVAAALQNYAAKGKRRRSLLGKKTPPPHSLTRKATPPPAAVHLAPMSSPAHYQGTEVESRLSRLSAGGRSNLGGRNTAEPSLQSGAVLSRESGYRPVAGWTGEEAKAKRAEFLALQAAKAEGTSTVSSLSGNTLESVTARYSKTKYKYFFYEFENEEVEADFIKDLGEKQGKLRIASRAGMLALALMILLSIGGINGGKFSTLATVLFPLAVLIFLLDLLVCLFVSPKSKFFAPKLQTLLQLAGAIMLMLASGFVELGESSATNDLTYLGLAVAAFLGFGNLGFVSWLTICFIVFSVITPVTLWGIWEGVPLTTYMFFILFTAIVQAPVFIVTERLYRIQFLQHYIAEFFRAQQNDRTIEQESLLSSIVPAHIVPDLMQWMQTGMDPTKTIVQQLPVTAVAFLQIDMKSFLRRNANGDGEEIPLPHPIYSIRSNHLDVMMNGSVTPTSAGDGIIFPTPQNLHQPGSGPSSAASSVTEITPTNNVNSKVGGGGGGRSKMTVLLPPRAGSPDARPADKPVLTLGSLDSPAAQQELDETSAVDTLRCPSEVSSNNRLDVVGPSGAVGETTSQRHHQQQHHKISNLNAVGLREIHIQIDTLLKSFSSVIKIKTIGDVVMMAGPFVPGYDLDTTADELLMAVWRIHEVSKVRAGLHCGELVAAVLGNSRLCFDIFGDTVNMASRTMTSGKTGDISISDAFYATLPSSGAKRRRGSLSSDCDSSSNHTHNSSETSGPTSASPNTWLTEKAVFSSEVLEVEAKGKGTIRVRRVVSI